MNRLALIPLFIAAGCSQQMYEGDSLEPEQVARIETRGVDLHSIDGQAVKSNARVVEVLPGNHVIEARVVTPSPFATPRRLAFNMSAGQVYYIAGTSAFPTCIRVQNKQGSTILQDAEGCKGGLR